MPQTTLAGKIAAFRDDLDLSQEEFANALGVKRLAVLMWEKGKSGYEPSAESRIRLARLAQNAIQFKTAQAETFVSYARFFWESVGVDDEALRVLVPSLEQSFRRFEKHLSEKREVTSASVQLPLVTGRFDDQDYAGISSGLRSILRDGTEKYVSFPSQYIPRPNATVCLLAPDPYMRPIFDQGDPVAVDLSFGGHVTADYASKMAERFGWISEKSRSLVAVHYTRPTKPTGFWGRGGVHVRSLQFHPNGKIDLYTELGIVTASIAHHLAQLRTSDRAAMEKELVGAMRGFGPTAVPENELAAEMLEMAPMVVPDDRGIAVLGKVVAWIGSSKEVVPIDSGEKPPAARTKK